MIISIPKTKTLLSIDNVGWAEMHYLKKIRFILTQMLTLTLKRKLSVPDYRL